MAMTGGIFEGLQRTAFIAVIVLGHAEAESFGYVFERTGNYRHSGRSGSGVKSIRHCNGSAARTDETKTINSRSDDPGRLHRVL
jgi:hypothetical protein